MSYLADPKMQTLIKPIMQLRFGHGVVTVIHLQILHVTIYLLTFPLPINREGHVL